MSVTAPVSAGGRTRSRAKPAVYLTMSVDDNAARAEQRINEFLSAYYGQRPNM